MLAYAASLLLSSAVTTPLCTLCPPMVPHLTRPNAKVLHLVAGGEARSSLATATQDSVELAVCTAAVEPNARAFFGRHHVLAALEQWEQALQNGDSGEEEAAAALKEILALPEREIAIVSDPRLLHHWTNAGQQPLVAQPHSLRLDPRLRPATPPAPGYAAEEALQALSDQPPLVGYPSPHMERMLRPPFEDGEFRIVVAVPPPS